MRRSFPTFVIHQTSHYPKGLNRLETDRRLDESSVVILPQMTTGSLATPVTLNCPAFNMHIQ